jgi:hypothetical protein
MARNPSIMLQSILDPAWGHAFDNVIERGRRTGLPTMLHASARAVDLPWRLCPVETDGPVAA